MSYKQRIAELERENGRLMGAIRWAANRLRCAAGDYDRIDVISVLDLILATPPTENDETQRQRI